MIPGICVCLFSVIEVSISVPMPRSLVHMYQVPGVESLSLSSTLLYF